ncbi:MAG: YbjQ family protein [Eubacterium sp.]
MIVVTTDFITGKEIETIGLVKGATIQCAHVGKDIMSSFKTIVGGEMKSYTDMMVKGRELAIQRMVNEAGSMGADGIVNVRFCSSSVTQGASEIMVSGTAVKFKN